MVSGTGTTQPFRTRTTVTEDFTKTQLALAADRRAEEQLLLQKDALKAKKEDAKTKGYDLYKKDLIDTEKSFKDFQVGTAVSAKKASETYQKNAWNMNIAVQEGRLDPNVFSEWKANANSSLFSHQQAADRVLKFKEELSNLDANKFNKEELKKINNDFNSWVKISGNWNFNEETGKVQYYDDKMNVISMDEFYEGTIPPDMKEMRINQLDVLNGKIGDNTYAQNTFVGINPDGSAFLNISEESVGNAMNGSKLFMGNDYGYIEENITEDYMDATFPDSEGNLSDKQQKQVQTNGTKKTTDAIIDLYTRWANPIINKINADKKKAERKDTTKPPLYVLQPNERSYTNGVTSKGVVISPNPQRTTGKPSDSIGGYKVKIEGGKPAFDANGDLIMIGSGEDFAKEQKEDQESANADVTMTKEGYADASVGGYVDYVEKLSVPQADGRDILVTVTVPKVALNLAQEGGGQNLLTVGESTQYILLVDKDELKRLSGRMEGLDKFVVGGNSVDDFRATKDAENKKMTKEQEDMLKSEAEGGDDTYMVGSDSYTKEELKGAGWTDEQLIELKSKQQ